MINPKVRLVFIIFMVQDENRLNLGGVDMLETYRQNLQFIVLYTSHFHLIISLLLMIYVIPMKSHYFCIYL